MKTKKNQAILEDHDDALLESQLIDYLKANPDFFCRHEELLCDLEIPHRAGSAVSLVERQVTLLRERNIDMRHRLARIVETARSNDKLFAKTRDLVLQLLEQDDADALVDCLGSLLRREIGADFCAVKLFPEQDISPDASGALGSLKALFAQDKRLCGPLRSNERQLLFAGDADAVESAAVVPLKQGSRVIGALAVGSSDPACFQVDMGTLFLDFIADVAVRRLVECPTS